MKPFTEFPVHFKNRIRFILTDIDDTLTTKGRISSAVFLAMERLRGAGLGIVAITGRPAGWCDHMARMWPIDGVVGENGAFYFHYDRHSKKMTRRYWKTDSERRQDRKKLDALKETILRQVPGCRVAADQAYREADLAIDFCEDVPPLSRKDVNEILRCFTDGGAQAKISSIHVNGWFGDYDKLSMTRLFFKDIFNEELDGIRSSAIYIGDSPNDAPMFGYFPHSVGVNNILEFTDELADHPAWITRQAGGIGFAEMVSHLLG